MRTYKDLYYVISYSLLAAQAGLVFILIYNKIVRDQVLYYGNTGKPYEISENYFYVLKFLLYTTFVLMIIWALLTPLAVISNKRSTEKDQIPVAIGLLGFISALILLIIDPFGIFKWFTG
jgi:hypothetical protein